VKECGAISVYSDSLVDVVAGDSVTTLTNACQSTVQLIMPLSTGYVDGNLMTVLRDTLCSGIVVRRNKIRDENLTGKMQTCVLADRTKVNAPVANICIDTPCLIGTYEDRCMESPIHVYDLIIGNVDLATAPGNPDPEWSESAVETRQQAYAKQKPYPKLKVPEIVKDYLSPQDIMLAQQQDKAFDKSLEYVKKCVSRDRTRWFLKNGLVYREYVSSDENGKVFTQLVVPSPYRSTVTKLAHESIMSGHLATRRTVS